MQWQRGTTVTITQRNYRQQCLQNASAEYWSCIVFFWYFPNFKALYKETLIHSLSLKSRVATEFHFFLSLCLN